MSKIIVESELMKNQKAASILPAQSSFNSHQCQSGASIFLAISDSGVFNLLKEQNEDSLGWISINLCAGLSEFYQNKQIRVKSFASEQNFTNGNIDIAIVISVADDANTYLYVATSLSNADTASWMSDTSEISWQAIPYDDTAHPLSTINISNVYLSPQQSEVNDSQLVCEVNINNYLQNYTVNLSGTDAWDQLLTPENFDTLLDSAVGKASASDFTGLYQLTSINGSIGLNFIPLQSFFGPPSIIKMTAPDGASKIATLTVDNQNNTNLFVAASGTIYLFTPDNQKNNTGGTAIITNSIIEGLQDFYAHQSMTKTILWGLDQQGQVFYTSCIKGQEAVPEDWSAPIPIIDNVERISSYVNVTSGQIIIFAHTSDQNITQLSQDITNSLWQQRNILLPAPDYNTVQEYNTFTSNILLTDDNGLPLNTVSATITSINQCTVYINSVYHILSPTIPISIMPDNTGNISIVQETQTLGAVCYKIELEGLSIDVNPMSKIITTLSTIQNGNQLSEIQIDNGDGTTQPLIGNNVSDDQKNATASALQQFVIIAGTLPTDGSAKQSPSNKTQILITENQTNYLDKIWGVSYKDGFHYFEGAQSLRLPDTYLINPSVVLKGTVDSVSSIWDAIETAAGDLWNWLKHAYQEVTQFFVAIKDDLYHFFMEIGGILYRAVITCINDIVQAVEFVFNKIEVAFEDLIKWLGFIFSWNDIVRTHNVLKNVISTYLNQAIANLKGYPDQIKNTFADIESYIAVWADIPANIPATLQNSTRGNSNASAPQPSGTNTPQSNWGITHAKSGAGSANISADGTLGDIESILAPLLALLENEKDILQGAYESFKSDIIDQIDQLSFVEIVKAVVAIIANSLLESVENILIASMEVFINLAQDIVRLLNETIDIPVISWLYKKVSGNDLSMLDLVCLIIAVPTTVVYKIIAGEAPFPDNNVTTELIQAPDFESLRNLCNGNTSSINKLDANAHTLMVSADEKTTNQKLVLAAGICSTIGAVGVSVFGPLKTKFPTGIPGKVFSALNGGSYLAYALPDIVGQIPDLKDKKWWAITNEIVTDICIIKAMIDMSIGFKKVPSPGWNAFSPWFDFGSNIVWQVPTTAAIFDPENQNTPGILSYWGGTCFDCSGILSPVLADDEEPISWAVAVGINAVFNAGYGSMSCASSALLFEQNS